MVLLSALPMRVTAEDNTKLSQNKITIYQTGTKKLKLKNAKEQVFWSSTNLAVAAVDQSGRVSAIAAGSCRIKAACGNVTYICKVKVKKIRLNDQEVTLVRGRQVQLKANYSKANKGTWTSSEPSVASVDKTGCVQTKQPGKAVITLAWKGKRLNCSINVIKASVENLVSTYKADKSNRGKIILAGSSSMDFWNSAPQAFAPYEVINTAIGGTTVTQWLKWYKKLIIRYRPIAVVLYVGSNDLANGNGVSGEVNAKNTIQFLNRIQKKLKKTPIFYVSVNPCMARRGAWKEIAVSNRLVKQFCKKKSYLYYIDTASAFTRIDGTPDTSMFLWDQLHPNEKGYRIWKKLIAAKVKKVVKKRS